MGFTRLELHYRIFESVDKQIFIAFYVNELLIFSLDIACLEDMQQKLQNQFKITDLGDIFYYLKMYIDYGINKKITRYQSTYLKKVFNHLKIT